jgi:hypothetical protein
MVVASESRRPKAVEGFQHSDPIGDAIDVRWSRILHCRLRGLRLLLGGVVHAWCHILCCIVPEESCQITYGA